MKTRADEAAGALVRLQKWAGYSPAAVDDSAIVAGYIDDLLEVARQFRGLQEADGMACTCEPDDKCPACKTTDVLS